MRRRLFWGAAVILVLTGLPAALYFTRDLWRGRLFPAKEAAAADHKDHAHAERVQLTPQARDNLKLEVKPVQAQTYWRTLQVPGVIVDRPGVSDRGITAPVTAVVSKIHAYPGDTVRPGETLLTMRLISEYAQNAQADLFKTAKEIQLNQALLRRAKDPMVAAAIPEARIIELENQHSRLLVQEQSHWQDLLTRGFTPEQIEGVTAGKFVKEIVILAPRPGEDNTALVGPRLPVPLPPLPLGKGRRDEFAYEVQDLKVHLGEHVQAGQVLLMLSNHDSLYIEGRGFKKEAALLERAAQHSWPVEAEFAEDDPRTWPPLEESFTIRHLANTIDPASRTFGFFIPLSNQSRSYAKDGRTYLVWRFRPGQRVRLHVPVEEFKEVLVLPAGAVVREGPEVYVFRQNGDAFDRKPVRLLFEDRRHVVLANDGSLPLGVFVAQNGAAALNRVLKAQQSQGEGGHDHAGHSH